MPEQTLQAALQAQLTAIEREIRQLETQKRLVQQMLASAKFDGIDGALGRRNSAQRLLIEKEILDLLGIRPSSGERIFQHIRLAHRSLKPATFRSYLHRLKERRLIAPEGTRGVWRLGT